MTNPVVGGDVAGEDVVKTAVSPLARQRLRAEAAALRRAAHPDVARLRTFLDLDDRSELRLVRAGDRTLVDAPPTDATDALECATTLTAAVSDLHAMGIVHGRLGPDHVVLRPDGRPVLCGLAEAGPGDPTPDIRALGTLYELLAEASAAGRSRRDRAAIAALLTAADHARCSQPAATATDLLSRLHEPSRGRRASAARRRAPSARALALAGIAVCAVLGVVAATRVLGGDGSWAFEQLGDAPPTSVPPTSVPSTSAPLPSAPPAPSPSSTAPLPGAVRFEADGAAFAVGDEGDSVVVGDWDCDGVTGAALLRPDSGEVFVFDRLASPGAAITGRLVATLPGAITLEAVEQPSGCDALVIRHRDETPQVIRVEEP